MTTAVVLAQFAPTHESSLRQLLWDTYVPQIVAGLIVLALALYLVKTGPRRSSSTTKKEQLPIPDWYPDPWGQPCERWWNGVTWTPAVRPYPYQYPYSVQYPYPEQRPGPGPNGPTAPPGPPAS
jgi:hypothetical protein